MEDERKRLGDGELELMQTIWRAGEPVNSGYVLQALQGRRTWALATVLTVLNRLVDKGFLTCEKQSRNNQYAAAVSEADYQQKEGRTVLEKLYGNSVTGLVASLYQGKTIDDGDLEELRRFLAEQEGTHHA
ncbi:MAG: BlaI/MecI/CopY family transcriptional regulator [Oscillospiraceae bacterium]